MKKSKLLIGMIVINLISMVLGFLRDTSIAYSLGATNLSDIFIFITNLPTILFSAIGWVIISTFVPVYTDVRLKSSEEETNKFANTFIKLIILLALIMMIIMYIFNKEAITILAPGFVEKDFELTKEMFFIALPSFVLLTASSCLCAILNSYKKMLWVSSIGIPVNIMIIIGILFIYPLYGINVAVWMLIVASIIQIIILVIPLRKTNFKFTLDFNLKDKNIIRIVGMIGPMIIGVMAQQINMMFGGAITSTLNSGSLTSYNLANKVTNAAYNSIILIGITFIFPYLSENYAKGRYDTFIKQIKNAVHIILLVLIPISILLIVLNDNIISILYGYGKFSPDDIKLTGEVLIFLSISIVGLGIRELVNRAYYASNNTKIPMIFSILGIIINIIVSLVLVYKIGVIGVAIGNSISIIISSCLITRSFEKNNDIGSIINKKFIIKYLFITIILFYSTKLINSYINNFININLLNLILVSIISSIFYIILLYIFKIDIYKFTKSVFNKN
ncbi:murein biosynthesis integral membrane protein MurJ [Clostridium baratii]|uniref:murein biosynthesis integral membrane protein MurJ n=1 Tax=Clostridium baratii TaxID=1561 RepID=UPI0030D11598